MSVSIDCACIEDSYIRSNGPTTNYGGEWNIYLFAWSDNRYGRGVLKFDFSGIPAGATFVSAYFHFYTPVNSGHYRIGTRLYRLTQNWSEYSVTWNYPWGSNGGWDNKAGLLGTWESQNLSQWWAVPLDLTEFGLMYNTNYGMLWHYPSNPYNSQTKSVYSRHGNYPPFIRVVYEPKVSTSQIIFY